MDNEVDPRQMTDEQFAAYVKAVLTKAEAQAEARGIPAEKLQAVRDGLEDWQKKRIQSDLEDQRAAISKAKMEEAGRNLLQALEDHMPDDELPN